MDKPSTVQREYQICSNCVMDTTDSRIQFDERGYCDHCNNFYDSILPNWHPNDVGARELDGIARQIRNDGTGKQYDCLIGLSGGLDSSYTVYVAKETMGLRPLIFTVDTGWNSDVANRNIERLVRGLRLDVHREVIDWEEMKDLQTAFLRSQVPYQDIVQDHAIFAGLYDFAAKNGFRYVLTGANYSTEGVREPSEWVHVNDTALMKDIHARFGTKPLRNFPVCSMFRYRLYYCYIKGMRIIKPLNLVPYTKQAAINELENQFGWEGYGNKHYESVFTRFLEGYWLVRKFGYDKRRAYYSSLILSGQMTRDEALRLLEKPPYDVEKAMTDLDFVSNRLGMPKEEIFELMRGENKTYRDYKSDLHVITLMIRLARLFGIERRNLR